MKLPAHVLFRKELSLMVWKPHGVLNQALVNEIVEFVEAAEERAQKGKAPKPQMEQEALDMLKSDPQMRSAFINKVAAPIANKMFECGMIP